MSTGRKEIAPDLLADVKNYIDITWSDDATDSKIRGIIASGMVFLEKKAGEELDFLSDGLPRTLLMEYARYARDGALDVFENNYLSMLLAMRDDKVVSRYGASTEAALSL